MVAADTAVKKIQYNQELIFFFSYRQQKKLNAYQIVDRMTLPEMQLIITIQSLFIYLSL